MDEEWNERLHFVEKKVSFIITGKKGKASQLAYRKSLLRR